MEAIHFDHFTIVRLILTHTDKLTIQKEEQLYPLAVDLDSNVHYRTQLAHLVEVLFNELLTCPTHSWNVYWGPRLVASSLAGVIEQLPDYATFQPRITPTHHRGKP